MDMRSFFIILSVMTVLLIGCRQSSTGIAKEPLSFYVVNNSYVDGGRFIDAPNCPKLGYIAATPDLVITQLEAVKLIISRVPSFTVDYTTDTNGRRTAGPTVEDRQLLISMFSEDAKKFEALTTRTVGKQIVMMLGDTPLYHAEVLMPISTTGVQMTFGKLTLNQQKKIQECLEKLVKQSGSSNIDSTQKK